MDAPTIRPGLTVRPIVKPNLFAYFHNAAAGNAAIQFLTGLGISEEDLGVTPPELIPGSAGMVLSLVCPSELRIRVEAACRTFGATVHRAPR